MLHGFPPSTTAQPGPSRLPDTSETPPVADTAGANGKRQKKRSSPGTRAKQRDANKKKKANRACIHCQKAHLTCDDTRPCQRCIRRGIGESCIEGVRKKAKYLLDDEEIAELRKQKGTRGPEDAPLANGNGGLGLETFSSHHPHDPLHNVQLDTKHPFDSQAVNLEYSFMSAILGSEPSNGTPPYATGAYPSMNMPFVSPGSEFGQQFTSATLGATETTQAAYGGSPVQQEPSRMPPLNLQRPPPVPSAPMTGSSGSRQGQTAIYRSVTKAYDYREGFHFLMSHLKERYVKNDILRIIRAIAIFRPSIIALCMDLSEEDEVFVEKCFQRSVLELEKLVSFNGTPTVAWRRTGEICVVGVEFSVLTGWTRQELLGPQKYIYELFENQSAVEYWEQFATHAFENTTQSVHTHCVLLTKTGQPILTAFCFSIRRDIFDLPNIVIGQWLPLLS